MLNQMSGQREFVIYILLRYILTYIYTNLGTSNAFAYIANLGPAMRMFFYWPANSLADPQ